MAMRALLLSRYRSVCTSSSAFTPKRPHASRWALSPRRGLSAAAGSEKKMTAEEVELALEKANNSMKDYYSYPPEKVIAANKLKFEQRHRDGQHFLQLALGMSLLCSFLITPFLGRKIAYDEEFKKKYIPDWYDYSIEKPKSAWTREELNKHIMRMRRELHERAIAGEFTPEKLEKMRRTIDKKPEDEQHAHFAQLHPGVDDDEDLEDD